MELKIIIEFLKSIPKDFAGTILLALFIIYLLIYYMRKTNDRWADTLEKMSQSIDQLGNLNSKAIGELKGTMESFSSTLVPLIIANFGGVKNSQEGHSDEKSE